MTSAFLSALALASRLGLPAADVSTPARPLAALSLRGHVSVWKQDCAPACGLPSALVANDPVATVLPLPEKAGEFRATKLERTYTANGRPLKIKADFYAVCPKPAADCAGRYFTVQVELSGAAAAFCTATLNAADVSPFPVLACAAPNGSQRIGITLHRNKLP